VLQFTISTSFPPDVWGLFFFWNNMKISIPAHKTTPPAALPPMITTFLSSLFPDL